MKPPAGTSLDIRRARLVIGRVGERDAMTLKCKVDAPAVNLADAVAASLQSVTKLCRMTARSLTTAASMVSGSGSQYHNLAPIRSNRRHTMGV